MLIVGSVIMLFPFLWMISTSLKGNESILSDSIELMPRDKKSVIIEGIERPIYDVDVDGTRREMALIRTQDEGMGLFQDPLDPGDQVTLPIALQVPVRPISFHWQNYPDAWNAQPFGRYFLNTIFVALVSVICQLFFSSLAAYAFAFFRFPFKNAIFIFLLGTMMLPQQALLIPNYVILAKLRWLDTYLALIVPFHRQRLLGLLFPPVLSDTAPRSPRCRNR